MAHRGEAPPHRPDDLISVPKSPVEGKNQLRKAFPWPARPCRTPALKTTLRVCPFCGKPRIALGPTVVGAHGIRTSQLTASSWLWLQTLNKGHPKVEKQKGLHDGDKRTCGDNKSSSLTVLVVLPCQKIKIITIKKPRKSKTKEGSGVYRVRMSFS